MMIPCKNPALSTDGRVTAATTVTGQTKGARCTLVGRGIIEIDASRRVEHGCRHGRFGQAVTPRTQVLVKQCRSVKHVEAMRHA
jgi:hypothetical protein